MSEAVPEDCPEPLPTPCSLRASRSWFDLARRLLVGLPNGQTRPLEAVINERSLLMITGASACPDRLTAEVAWVEERLEPDLPLVVIGDVVMIEAGLIQIPHPRARAYQDIDGKLARALSPTAPRTAYLIDPAARLMTRINAKDHLFDLGREVRKTDERGSDRVLDLGDVFR